MEDGGFAEYVKVPAYQLHRIPDEISYLQGSLVEPLSVGLHGVLTSIMEAGDAIAVLGCGIIGLSTLLWAKTLGAGLVIASEISESRISAASQIADVVLNPTKVDLGTELEKLTNDLGPRVVFECTGIPDIQAETLDLVQRSGEVVMLGISYDPVPIMLLTLALKGITIKGSQAYASLDGEGEFPMAINFLKTGRINTDFIPLTEMPLEDINKGFQATLKGDVAKVIINP